MMLCLVRNWMVLWLVVLGDSDARSGRGPTPAWGRAGPPSERTGLLVVVLLLRLLKLREMREGWRVLLIRRLRRGGMHHLRGLLGETVLLLRLEPRRR